MQSGSSRRLIHAALIFLAVMGSDQYTKYLASLCLRGASPSYWLGGIFQLIYSENRGAWGGLGSRWGEIPSLLFLVVLPAAALTIVSVQLVRHKITDTRLFYGCAFLVAGGASNLIDRLARGWVIDFMYLGVGRVGTNIFNIADMSIMLGAGFILWSGFSKKKK